MEIQTISSLVQGLLNSGQPLKPNQKYLLGQIDLVKRPNDLSQDQRLNFELRLAELIQRDPLVCEYLSQLMCYRSVEETADHFFALEDDLLLQHRYHKDLESVDDICVLCGNLKVEHRDFAPEPQPQEQITLLLGVNSLVRKIS